MSTSTSWLARQKDEEPRVCPRCKSPNWDGPRPGESEGGGHATAKATRAGKAGQEEGGPQAWAEAHRCVGPCGSTSGGAAPQRGPVELIDRLFELADECGGMGQLKRPVDRLAAI